MTLTDRAVSRSDFYASSGGRESGGGPMQQARQRRGINVGGGERAVSVAAGALLAVEGLSRRSVPGLLIAAVGGSLLYRGATGHCSLYQAMGIDTAEDERRARTPGEIAAKGVHIAQAFTINKPAQELYDYWRDFQNLPRIMSHLESVTVLDDRRSHWVAKAPKLAGGKMEWDAEITTDRPGELIAWRSLPGSDIDTSGQVRLNPNLGDRGTEIHAYMDYVPPAGKLGHLIASMLGENPKRVVREDLRNFKRTMELGEIPTIQGQPHGTCTGRGVRQFESAWRPLFS